MYEGKTQKHYEHFIDFKEFETVHTKMSCFCLKKSLKNHFRLVNKSPQDSKNCGRQKVLRLKDFNSIFYVFPPF